MEKIEVRFYDQVKDEDIRFVVIAAQYQNKWVWAKHKERDTYEIVGGHREDGESVLDAAHRELQEESGALRYELQKIDAYSVTGKTRVNDTGKESMGMLYYAKIEELGEIHSEIESIALFDELPSKLTYPQIQPILLSHVIEKMKDADRKLKKP